jgi:hypothetical protein
MSNVRAGFFTIFILRYDDHFFCDVTGLLEGCFSDVETSSAIFNFLQQPFFLEQLAKDSFENTKHSNP